MPDGLLPDMGKGILNPVLCELKGTVPEHLACTYSP